MVNTLQKDVLTGVWNRETFFQKAALEIAKTPEGSLILGCVDIDGFKVINDQFGGDVGDRVLKSLASALRQSCENRGGTCGRISADSFVTLYPRHLANSGDISPQVLATRVFADTGMKLTLSVGRYIVEDKSLSVSAMYDRATLALGTVKGRYDAHVAVYDEAMRSHLVREQQIVNDMNAALTEKQFEVWFQPQYNHVTGALIGAEALARWRHPARGLIPPGEFIPVFERNGFVYELDKYVWEQVCACLREWIDAGRSPLPVSVNISRYDVFRNDLVNVISDLIARYGIPIELLRLEITESAFSTATRQIIDTVKKLIERGFTVEIDDFGSGYSSLNTLKNVPAQVVKLDMRFFEDDDGSQRGGNIIESVVRMTKWLGMSVIAEGVEKKAQADYLASIGCNYIQGYLYAKPMPRENYEELCRGAGKEEKLIALETVENLNNNAFWDPQSMDTLIFNSFVGGACIYEYSRGKIELLRATEKYAQVIGSAGMTVEDALKLNWTAHLDEESGKRIIADLDESVATRKEVTGEYIFLDLPGCPHETHLRSTMRVIASVGDRFLVYCTNENITAQCQSEQREREAVERMRLIMDNVNGGICAAHRVDGHLRIVFANDTFYAMYGYTKAQFDAELDDPLDVIDPDDRAALQKALETLTRERGSATWEYRCVRRDGQHINVRCNSTVAALTGVSDAALISVITDTTELARTRQKEKLASRQLQVIMDNIDGGVTATVIEKDRLRLIFANDRYFEQLGYTRAQYEAQFQGIPSNIVPEDRQMVMDRCRAISASGKPDSFMFRILRTDGAVRWLRSNITAVNYPGVNEPVQLSVTNDITEQVEAERNALRLSEQMRAVMDNVDVGIIAVAVEDASARFVFANNRYYAMLGYTKEQFESEIGSPYETVAPEDQQRVTDETVRVNREGESTVMEYGAILRDGSRRSIRSSISTRRLLGVAGLVQLSILRDITEEKAAERREKRAEDRAQTMINDMPGGFVRMVVDADGSVRPIYFNEGFFRLTGMNYDELMAIYAQDAMAGVHPDDAGVVRDAVERMLQNGEAHSGRYRLRHANGGYVWLSFFGRVTRDASGGAFLNIYYTDATEQMEQEERRKELLDNLPGGAALYEYENGAFRVIHLNRRYWELVGRAPRESAGLSPLEAVFPDDRETIAREAASAIEQGRDMTCDLRLRHETDGYRTFHLIGRILPQKNGIYFICAIFTAVSDEIASMREMLPIALSVMMEKREDFAFIKDRERKYVCCSRAVAELAGSGDAAEMVGKTDDDLLEKSLAHGFHCEDDRVLEGETILDSVSRIPSANGTDRFATTSKFPLKDSRGNIIGIYGSGHDTTETRAMKSQLELLTNSIPGGLATYVCTPGEFTAANIRIVYFNDGFCRLFGLTREAYERRALQDPVGSVFKEDRRILAGQWRALMEHDTPVNCLLRVHIEDGSFRWISHKAVAADRSGGRVTVNAILQDVTDQREMIERLRISQEENDLAVHLSGNIICRYIVADASLTLTSDIASSIAMPEKIYGVPYEQVRQGMISPESANAYIGFFEAILHGSRAGTVLFQQRYLGSWRWMEAKSSTIFSDDGQPVKAVISLLDVTERLEKETIYKKWQQSLEDKKPESYTLFRCNLSNNTTFDTADGTLIAYDFDRAGRDFNERAREYVRQCVCEEDQDRYTAFANSDTLLAGYYRGKRSDALEYREKLPGDECRWLRLTVDLVEHPNSTEVEAYLMYENIDEAKRAELKTRALAETDPLTGILNRGAFTEQVRQALHTAKPGTRHAFLLMDIDGFKQVNDVFGHGTGDQALVDVAGALRSMLRRADLLGRIGGDEFVVFLSDVADDGSIANKAMQVCAVARKSFSLEVCITGSTGIAVFPRDGMDFETLYKKADAALYYVKGSGKDNCAFYRDDMADEHLKPEADSESPQRKEKKRRMLIVDDSEMAHLMLGNIFAEEFLIEKAKDGNSALIRLRHYGNAISVVLLDLMMPGMDGFAVLKKMRESAEMRSIPVIVVTGDGKRETNLRAIREGAVDFVTKPVDPDVLRIRVQSAISKAENERLRARNSALEYRESEMEKYQSVLDQCGIIVVEHEWIGGKFTYDPAMSSCLAGNYDDRGLWHILLADFVADTGTVKRMQETVHQVAADRRKTAENLVVRLKTSSGDSHWFRMGARKVTNRFGLTGKIYLSFIDLGTELPALP